MSNLFQSASVITITNEMYSSFETAGRRLQGPLKERTVLTLSATSTEVTFWLSRSVGVAPPSHL